MGFHSPLSYTIGNWTLTSLTTDTDAAGKAVTIPDLTVADYSKIKDEPDEARVANITGTELETSEVLRFGKTKITNIYAGSQIGASNQMPVKTGIRTLVEASSTIKAVNSVSGEEYLIPVRSWVVTQVPTASFISSAVLEYSVGRAFGACFKNNSSNTDRLEEVARGSLLPS